MLRVMFFSRPPFVLVYCHVRIMAGGKDVVIVVVAFDVDVDYYEIVK